MICPLFVFRRRLTETFEIKMGDARWKLRALNAAYVLKMALLFQGIKVSAEYNTHQPDVRLHAHVHNVDKDDFNFTAGKRYLPLFISANSV